jgi:hypothetical protein
LFETKGCFKPLLLNLALLFTIRRVQENQDGMKLDGTYQLLVYADDVNILGGSTYTTKKNTEALLVCSKETPLEVNVDKSKYMVMSRDHNAGRRHNTKTDNDFFESVEDFIYLETTYLGTTLTNQKAIQEEIKSTLKSGNVCY